MPPAPTYLYNHPRGFWFNGVGRKVHGRSSMRGQQKEHFILHTFINFEELGRVAGTQSGDIVLCRESCTTNA